MITKRFIAKAFIRVSNPITCEKDIQKIGDELFSKYLIAINSQKNGKLIVIDEGELWVYNEDTGFQLSEEVKNEFIDCNLYTNNNEEKAIELFLELAKMKGEGFDKRLINENLKTKNYELCNRTN